MKATIKQKNNQAFTLIELLVVIAIIGILTALAVVSLQNSRRSARDAKRVADVKQIQIALELYYQDNNSYPPTLNPGESLSSNSITYMEQIPYPPTNLDGDCSTTSYIYSTSNDNSYYTINFCISNNVGSFPAGEVVASPRGLGTWTCGEYLGDARNNQSYKTIQFGSQCWMAENLNVGTFTNPPATTTNENGINSTIEKYCYGNNESDCNLYGGLYQWSEAMNYTTSTSQGICPDGWHIPTTEEFNTFVSYTYTNPNYLCGGHNGKALASNYGWNSTTTSCAIGNNQQTNNATGFNAYPAGFRALASSSFGGRGVYPCFWSSSSNSDSTAVVRYLYNLANSGFSNANDSRAYGYSIRCIKNL
jgi:uncharacterized protein (TIGR02145 family)/prepilin-type N-terminal cleavage/methylation domain-containing protein